jgi:outer membrane biosynthesis protein TonB
VGSGHASMRAAMPDLQQAVAIGETRRSPLREGAVVLASALAHVAILLGIFLFGSPRLLATVPPEAIVVDIVRPDEIPKGEATETAFGQKPAQQQQAQPAQQQQAQPPQQQQAQQPQQQQAQQPQQQQAQQPQQQQTPSTAAAPVFTSLYPWPVARPASDTQAGDYRTFESTEKLEDTRLAEFKTRLKECWKPPTVAANARKLTAAVRVALRIDGTLAGPPELVEATASPYGPALVESAMRAVNQCGPYGFLPADSYDTWKRLSLTFSPDDIAVAVVMK